MSKWTLKDSKDLYESSRVDGMDHRYMDLLKLPTVYKYDMNKYIAHLKKEIAKVKKRQEELLKNVGNWSYQPDEEKGAFLTKLLKALTCEQKELPLLINFDVPIPGIVKWRLKNNH